jgi:hypothetical protein
MPSNKTPLVSRSPSEDLSDETPDQIPAALLNALFGQESTGRKLPRAVMIGEDEVVVYQACKTVSADDLKHLEELTTSVASMEDIKGLAGRKIHKVILAVSCEGDIRLQAENRGIHVLTKDELVQTRNTPIQ